MSSPKFEAVVVTGASTGIGAACAQYLSERGFHVFAGVRKQADAEAITARGNPHLEPLILDVTKAETVSSTVRTVKAFTGSAGLAGLVNNAGVSYDEPLECVTIDDLRHQLEVNTIGPVAVAQAFLPMLREATGRIVNVGSINGLVATPMSGPYSMSKFAIEAFSDCLRRELAPWAIHVALIEPGAIKTAIWDKATAHDWSTKAPPDQLALYGDAYSAFRKVLAKAKQGAVPCDKVSEAVLHALTASKPKTRYLVGSDAKLLARLAALCSDRTLDWILSKAV
jgi:NAD(P)-dependent dehydrogenase (short-subunit alcohol dehydrogenase family)